MCNKKKDEINGGLVCVVWGKKNKNRVTYNEICKHDPVHLTLGNLHNM